VTLLKHPAPFGQELRNHIKAAAAFINMRAHVRSLPIAARPSAPAGRNVFTYWNPDSNHFADLAFRRVALISAP
jgi:hypothetical protein